MLGAEPASCFHSPSTTRTRRRSGVCVTATATSASPAQIAAAKRHSQSGHRTSRGAQPAHAPDTNFESAPDRQGQHIQLSNSVFGETNLSAAMCAAGSVIPHGAPHELLPLSIGRPSSSSISTGPASTASATIHPPKKRQRVSFACEVSDNPEHSSSEHASHVQNKSPKSHSSMAPDDRCPEKQQSANAGMPATLFEGATGGVTAYAAQRANQARAEASTVHTRDKQDVALQTAARQAAARKRAAETAKALLPPPGYFASHVQPGSEANVAHFRALLAAHPGVLVTVQPCLCPNCSTIQKNDYSV